MGLQPAEVTLAYGQRAFPKLVEVLRLPEVSEETTVECLKLVLSLLSNQVSSTACLNTASILPLLLSLSTAGCNSRLFLSQSGQFYA